MKTQHFNDERWYENNDSFLKRIKKWFWWQPDVQKTFFETPISLFGHRITFQWFGVDIEPLLGSRRLCIHRERTKEGGWRWYIYLSHDSTPQGATTWLYHAPWEVAEMAKNKEEPDPERAARGSFDCRAYPPRPRVRN